MKPIIAKYNRDKLRDKIYASYLGKNIGGTIGAPYEGTKEFLDVKGFNSPPGKPLPNDDLDLQLVWLLAMEKEGPFHFNSRVLGEYWLTAISPFWNEYGRGKSNLLCGIPAPLSGELFNEKWNSSNGAWIRSEIWASLAPGYPSIAREYAFANASVDHGLGEGTYAEFFTASLQSSAYFMSDIRKIVEEGLKSIPQNCRVYKAVKLVLDEYDKGTPYRLVRDMLVKQSEDIGWFQAPANLGYVAIGLLYGEGDFKKSVLYATNCGDDTDCTAGTVGAILGIINGTNAIPNDWKQYVGDGIEFICVNTQYREFMPKTCSELTDRIMELIPIVLYAHNIKVEWTDGDDELPNFVQGVVNDRPFNANDIGKRSPWCFELPHSPYVDGYGEYDRKPVVKPGEKIKIRLAFTHATLDTFNIEIKPVLPEGWSIDCTKIINIAHELYYPLNYKEPTVWEGEVTVGEKTDAINHIYVIAKPVLHGQPVIADFVILS